MKYWGMFPKELRKFGMRLSFEEKTRIKGNRYILVVGRILYILEFYYLSYKYSKYKNESEL